MNTVFISSYFLGGSAGAALGSYGAHLASWIRLAVVGVLLAMAAGAINALTPARISQSHPRVDS
ncbi:MAG: hypothetical protein ACXVFQ_16960 [Solirubrobacteraceae bacterium]